MEISEKVYADVILPVPVEGLFTYEVPPFLNKKVSPFVRVLVQFGKKKLYTALLVNIHNSKPEAYDTKCLLDVIDENPVANEHQYKLWNWISAYYMCTLGEVFNAALPSGLKLQSETKVMPDLSFKDYNILSGDEVMIHRILTDKNCMTIREIDKMMSAGNAVMLVNSLIKKGVVLAEERIVEKYKPKRMPYLSLHKRYSNNEELESLFGQLKRARVQLDTLMLFLNETGALQQSSEILKEEFLRQTGAKSHALESLIKKGVIVQNNKEVSRLLKNTSEIIQAKELSDAQRKAMDDILFQFESRNVVLLNGVTSSGKTEVYIKLIEKVIEEGKQALYLVPEIALTAQMINRLKDVFGDKVGIYHSRFSDNERVEVWNNVANEESYSVILGVRSSVFLPFKKLGIILVDEEHENTYKQYDPAPRYNARDVAVIMGKIHSAKVLLGTATPSVESYFNAQTGKYGYVEMLTRYGNIQLPEIQVADTRKARKKKQMISHFTPFILEEMDRALTADEQVILFQNRRGFAPFLECETCGWIPVCKNCDVSLTYHKKINKLICHYCGYQIKPVQRCGNCNSHDIHTKGFGTEKIEEELKDIFPKARIQRMDLDSTRKKNSYERIIHEFELHKVDILVGTQMVTKGLDFDNVGLVGILNADNMLHFPDFRAHERSYQLMSQVSGRAGRKKKQGRVIIQSGDPDHPVIKNVIKSDYHSLFLQQVHERKEFKYPPYYRLVELMVKHKHKNILNTAARQLVEELRHHLKIPVLGPEYPLASRIQLYYQKRILIKINRSQLKENHKEKILEIIHRVKMSQNDKQLQVQINVDPQ